MGFFTRRAGNRLLDSLPAESYARLLPHLILINLKPNDTLYQARGQIEELYFPISCATSAVTLMGSGAVIEVATVGLEGALGMPALSVLPISRHRVFIQIGGRALWIDASHFNRIAEQDHQITMTMARYNLVFHLATVTKGPQTFRLVQECCEGWYSACTDYRSWLAP